MAEDQTNNSRPKSQDQNSTDQPKTDYFQIVYGNPPEPLTAKARRENRKAAVRERSIEYRHALIHFAEAMAALMRFDCLPGWMEVDLPDWACEVEDDLRRLCAVTHDQQLDAMVRMAKAYVNNRTGKKETVNER